jgi:hypothetical protein
MGFVHIHLRWHAHTHAQHITLLSSALLVSIDDYETKMKISVSLSLFFLGMEFVLSLSLLCSEVRDVDTVAK